METPEDIKVEDIHTEMKEAAEVPKVLKKFSKMTEKLLKKINGRITAERDILRKKINKIEEDNSNKINKFVDKTNDDLEKFKKRYKAIYGDLVSRVMVKMEGRIFSAEIFEQATLDLCVEKLYRIERAISPDDPIDEEDYQEYIVECAKKHEAFMQKHINEFARRQKEEADVAVQKQENSEDESTAETEDSTGGEDASGNSSHTEDGGATDSQDGGEAQPSA